MKLKAQLALWQRKQHYRYRKWRKLVDRNGSQAQRSHWFGLYQEANIKIAEIEDAIRQARAPKRTSEKGIALIKEFEGFPNLGRPYRDPVGIWTIGYGHIENVGPNSKPLTRKQADKLLRQDLKVKYEPPVRKLGIPLNQNQFDALVSAVYNLGPGILDPERTLGHYLRDRNYPKAADALLLYDHADGRQLPGLTRRRNAERKLFLS